MRSDRFKLLYGINNLNAIYKSRMRKHIFHFICCIPFLIILQQYREFQVTPLTIHHIWASPGPDLSNK